MSEKMKKIKEKEDEKGGGGDVIVLMCTDEEEAWRWEGGTLMTPMNTGDTKVMNANNGGY